MHEDVKCFEPLPVNPAGAKSSNGILLGFSKLFRKLYATEEYSEVVKMFRRIYTHTYGEPKLFLGSFSSWPCAWKFPLKMFYYSGDASNEEPKKATGLQKEQ